VNGHPAAAPLSEIAANGALTSRVRRAQERSETEDVAEDYAVTKPDQTDNTPCGT